MALAVGRHNQHIFDLLASVDCGTVATLHAFDAQAGVLFDDRDGVGSVLVAKQEASLKK